MTDDQITTQPANLGEVNLTLRYMQKGQDAQAVLLKEMNAKLDGIASNTVSSAAFIEFKNSMEKRIENLEKENEDRKTFQDTLTGKLWGIGIMAGAVVGTISFLANHFWK